VKLRCLVLCLSGLSLSSCANTQTTGERMGALGATMGDMPQWLGGEPAGLPPRPGTPGYDAWIAARTKEAARPKNTDPKTTSGASTSPGW
jgi:hypothetical protein